MNGSHDRFFHYPAGSKQGMRNIFFGIFKLKRVWTPIKFFP